MQKCDSCQRFAFQVCPDCAEFYPQMGFVFRKVGTNKMVLEVPPGFSVSVRDKKSGAEIAAYAAPVKRCFGKTRQAIANGLYSIADLMAKK